MSRNSAVVVALFVAVATGSSASAEPDPTPLEWLLRTRLTGANVRPHAGTKLWFRADSSKPIPAAGVDDGDTFKRLRDPSAGKVRVLVGGTNVELVLYVDRADLWTVATRPAILVSRRARALAPFTPLTPGVHLDVGAPLGLHKARGQVAKAWLKHPVIAADGYVDATATGIDFEKSARKRPATRGDLSVRAVRLRDRPGGAVIARLKPDSLGGSVRVKQLEVRGKHSLVVYSGEWATAVGWIPTAKLSRVGVGGGGMGFGRIGGTPRARLVANTILHDAREGRAVGLVTASASFRLLETQGRWRKVAVSTVAGEVELWASDERMSIGERSTTR